MKTQQLILSLTFVLAMMFTSCIENLNKNKEKKTSTETTTNATSPGGQSGVIDDVSQKNIVQVAVGSADHSTLVTAVKAGELVDALSNAGPFTVFAPTNEAFNKLPKGTVENLLKLENKENLQNILQYHVTIAVFKKEDLRDGQVLSQVNGDKITISVKGDKVKANNANIIATVPASNGLIHIIDEVLLPPGK